MKVVTGLLALASTMIFAIATGGEVVPPQTPRPNKTSAATAAAPSTVAAVASVNLILGTEHAIFYSGFE